MGINGLYKTALRYRVIQQKAPPQLKLLL